MKHTFIALMLGLVCGIGAHLLWFGARHPLPVDNLDSQLAWMKSDLHLTSVQLARIKALHDQSRPRMIALAREVVRMRREFSAIEETRQKAGEVDFVKVSRFVVQQRVLDHECLDSARQIVAATAEIMTPGQRDQYLAILTPAIQAAVTGALN
jgi:hypothetical protein